MTFNMSLPSPYSPRPADLRICQNIDVGTEQWTDALTYSLLSEQIGHEHQNFQIQKFKGGVRREVTQNCIHM
jgi:hypothetical protein